MKLWLIAGLLFATLSAWAQPPRPIRIPKEKKEKATQVLEALPEPPVAVLGETARLTFHISPLSNKGLLTQQVRDALKAIDKANGGAQLIKVRAFVVGTGDLRRIQQIIAEDFSDRRIPLPAISTLQAGRLPMTGAQVVLETVSVDKRSVNPNGLAFLGDRNKDLTTALARIRTLVDQSKLTASSILRITCFVPSLDDAAEAQKQLMTAFPRAAVNLLEPTRFGDAPQTVCDAVARRENEALADAVVRHEGAVLTTAPKLAFTGLQLSFRPDDADLKLTIARLAKNIESVKGTDVLYVSTYALRESVRARVDGLRTSNGSSMVVEGLPSLDAVAALEAIGAQR